MYGRSVVVLLALGGCVGSMVRAPKQIPASGIVECTDSRDIPITATVVAGVLGAGVAYGLTDMESVIENGGVLWFPLLASSSATLLFGAMEGFSHVNECREAKRLGVEIAERRSARARARVDAGTLWKRAAAAARADDCATVRELAQPIRELDAELHAVVFARDVAITRCLATRE